MNVRDTYSNNLCCSCGVCEGFCPSDAITLMIDANGFFKPVINSRCNDCGICHRFCPGINYFESDEKFNEKYVYGYSNNENLRKNASSGGIGTQLIMHLIRKKIVDYAVIVVSGENKKFEAIITDNLGKIYKSKGSKYCPVSFGDVLKNIRTMDASFVVIGTPCKIQSLKRYFMHIGMENKIKYYISLFCNNTPSYNATEYMLKMYGHENADEIIYRGGGWPGYVQIKERNEWNLYPYRKTMALGFMSNFKNLRCLLCTDPFGRDADLSLGDAYFIKEDDDELGNTFCIVRNPKMLNILNSMNANCEITLKEGPSIEKIVNAYSVLFNRKQTAISILNMMENIGLLVPNNSPNKQNKKSSKYYLFNIIRFKYRLLVTNLSKHRSFWKLLFKLKGGEHIKSEKITKVIDDEF